MEYDNSEERLGSGIITLSVLHFIMSFLSFVGAIIILIASSSIDFKNQLSSINVNLNTTTIIFQNIILRIILVVSLILILRKNKFGIYGYFLFAIASIISTIVTSGFNILSIILSLVFPILMGIFMFKKKNLFGFN